MHEGVTCKDDANHMSSHGLKMMLFFSLHGDSLHNKSGKIKSQTLARSSRVVIAINHIVSRAIVRCIIAEAGGPGGHI